MLTFVPIDYEYGAAIYNQILCSRRCWQVKQTNCSDFWKKSEANLSDLEENGIYCWAVACLQFVDWLLTITVLRKLREKIIINYAGVLTPNFSSNMLE